MPWYLYALIIGAIIAPFDALYVYIKAQRRKDALKRKKDAASDDGRSGKG